MSISPPSGSNSNRNKTASGLGRSNSWTGSKTLNTQAKPSSKTPSTQLFAQSSFKPAPAKSGKLQATPASSKASVNLLDPKSLAFQGDYKAPLLNARSMQSKPFGPASSFQKTPPGSVPAAFKKTQVTPAPSKASVNLLDPKSLAFQGDYKAPLLNARSMQSKPFGPASSFQKTPPGPVPNAFGKPMSTAPVPATRRNNPGLAAINALNLVEGEDSSCVSSVRANLKTGGLKGVSFSTGLDPNNARGFMVQMIQSGYWHPMSLPNATLKNIHSIAYGDAQAQVLTKKDYLEAVSNHSIPEGAVVFQTRHGWDYSEGAYGNDVGIVRNGAIFNYEQKKTMLVYGDMVEAVVLLPN